MPELTVHDVEGLIAEELPELVDFLSPTDGWRDADDSATYVAFVLLEGMWNWLFSLSTRRGRDAATRAWRLVEKLAGTRDPTLANALMVGLLEGHWPRAHAGMMGPNTRALYGEVMR